MWSANRNTNELVEAMGAYAASGLDAISVGLQGGSPCGNNPSNMHDEDHPQCGSEMYNRQTSAFGPDGALRLPFFDRLRRLLERADALGMVVILQALRTSRPGPTPAHHPRIPSHAAHPHTALSR